MRTIDVLVYVLRERRNVDAKFFDQTLCYRAVGCRTLNREGAAKPQAESAVHAELIALGMPAKVVVVVEDEDACFLSPRLTIEVRRGQAADATAHHDEVVGFAGVDRLSG